MLAQSTENCPEDCHFIFTKFLFLVAYWDEVYETDHKIHPKTTKGVETFSMKGSLNVQQCIYFGLEDDGCPILTE